MSDRPPPDERPPAPEAAAVPAPPTVPEPSPARYAATVRLIRSRLDDEARARPRPWWRRLP